MRKSEYEPYGEEWRKEINKFSKDQLIDKIKRLCMQHDARHLVDNMKKPKGRAVIAGNPTQEGN